MTILEQVCAVLTANGIGHALIGAAALAARGVARSTYDIDLITSDPRVLEPPLWQPLREGGATVDIRRGDADDPLGGVVCLRPCKTCGERSGSKPNCRR